MTTNEATVSYPAEIMAAELIPSYQAPDGAKIRWTIVSDVAPSPYADNPKRFRYLAVAAINEEGITTDELVRRATHCEGLRGLVDAKKFLAAQERIPRQYLLKDILFPGTKLRDPNGRECIPLIRYNPDEKRRKLHFPPIESVWSRDCIIACDQAKGGIN